MFIFLSCCCSKMYLVGDVLPSHLDEAEDSDSTFHWMS